MLFPVHREQSDCVPAHIDVETLHLRKQVPPIDIQFQIFHSAISLKFFIKYGHFSTL